MSYLWVLLLIAFPILLWKLTSPQFLVELVFASLKPLFKVSPHSKEYWDTLHQIDIEPNKEVRENLRNKLEELRKKEAKSN